MGAGEEARTENLDERNDAQWGGEGSGGASPYAALNRVRLYRNGKRYQFNLTDRARKPVKVYPRDVIEVPELNIPLGR